jgi:hypothetical protein
MQFETKRLKNKVVKTQGLRRCLTPFIFFSLFFFLMQFYKRMLHYKDFTKIVLQGDSWSEESMPAKIRIIIRRPQATANFLHH